MEFGSDKPANKDSAISSSEKIVLLTGFEPFRGETINSSWEAAKRLDGETIAGYKVLARELPASYSTVGPGLDKAIADTHPSFVIAVGETNGAYMTIESTATNLDKDSMADNSGDKRDGAPIAPNGESQFNSTLPQLDILINLQHAGINAQDSDSAGGFVCNHEFYLLEKRINEQDPKLQGGLVHVPMLPEQVADKPGHASMPLEREVDALKIVIETAVSEAAQIRKPTHDPTTNLFPIE